MLPTGRVNGKVYAVEPVYENFDVMKTNIKLNRLSNFGSYRFDRRKSGKIQNLVSACVNLCAMNKEVVGEEIVGEEEVPIETVDHFVKGKEPPQIIRMDFEGYEYEIFRRMTKTLKKTLPFG